MKDCDMSQGSVLGPDRYSDFTQPLGDLIRHFDIIPSSMQMTHKNTFILIPTQMRISRRQSVKWNFVVQKSETE